jgi:hypothetical protein
MLLPSVLISIEKELLLFFLMVSCDVKSKWVMGVMAGDGFSLVVGSRRSHECFKVRPSVRLHIWKVRPHTQTLSKLVEATRRQRKEELT